MLGLLLGVLLMKRVRRRLSPREGVPKMGVSTASQAVEALEELSKSFGTTETTSVSSKALLIRSSLLRRDRSSN